MAKKEKDVPRDEYGRELEQMWDDGVRILSYIKKHYKKSILQELDIIHKAFDDKDPLKVRNEVYNNADSIFKYIKDIKLERGKINPKVYLFITNGCEILYVNEDGEEVEDPEIISCEYNTLQDWTSNNFHEGTEKYADPACVLYTLLRVFSKFGNTAEEIDAVATQNILDISMKHITKWENDDDDEKLFNKPSKETQDV